MPDTLNKQQEHILPWLRFILFVDASTSISQNSEYLEIKLAYTYIEYIYTKFTLYTNIFYTLKALFWKLHPC